MRPIARALVLTSALTAASPLLAEELTVSDLKAFIAKLDAASERCDVDAVVDRISPLAIISGTRLAQGEPSFLRANRSQYAALMKQTCGTTTKHSRNNETISIDRDQATITADVASTYTYQGQTISIKSREKSVIELIDGKLMLVQVLINQTERSVEVASR